MYVQLIYIVAWVYRIFHLEFMNVRGIRACDSYFDIFTAHCRNVMKNSIAVAVYFALVVFRTIDQRKLLENRISIRLLLFILSPPFNVHTSQEIFTVHTRTYIAHLSLCAAVKWNICDRTVVLCQFLATFIVHFIIYCCAEHILLCRIVKSNKEIK